MKSLTENMSMKRNSVYGVLSILSAVVLCGLGTVTADDRPNILWITSEDNGPELGCYGDDYADTPHIDGLAKRSLRYKRCWSNAPVCAPARTTLISGMQACSLGGHHMRSGVRLPEDLRLYPEVLRDAGYYTSNRSKEDYNFAAASSDAGWNDSGKKAHWRNRDDDDTPFFSVFNFTVSHESKIRVRPHTPVHDPADAVLPAYHPDTPEVRRDWAQYYDKLSEMDEQVGDVLAQLKEDGLDESTIIFYYGDHGSGMPRSKRWPFDSGLHVPLLVHIPPKFRELAPRDYLPGGVTDRLVSFVDMAPTALSMAGIEPPSNMQGVPFAGEFNGEPKKLIFGFRGRMDERIDEVRSCTDGRFVYMKHFYPERPYLKHVSYMFETPTTQVWKRLFDEGKLNEAQSKFWQPKPSEELFDLENDPDETVNLATLPKYDEKVAEMRQALKDWMVEIRDLGMLPEAEIHRRSGSMPPRTFGLSGDYPIEKLVDVAFSATDQSRVPTLSQVTDWLRDSESGVRFWAVKSLLLRSGNAWKEDSATQTILSAAFIDPSPIVRVALTDVVLAQGIDDWTDRARDGLLNLANVDRNGHFVAVAALNVFDRNWDQIDESTRAQVAQLPTSVKRPPDRVGKYVQRLLSHVTKESESP
ncbi:MAG: sulfatase [Planctomycetota bacterium]